jgi:predicted nucleotidyltransferase
MDMLNEDFAEFARLLEKADVRYLIVGGYSVALHGFPRYTGDIDFFVALNPENAAKLVRVFEQFGFADLGLREEDFSRPNYVIEIGREPRKIQILTGIDGVRFEDAWANRVEEDIDGMNLKFIGKKDLLINKRASGRPKDEIDLLELEDK